MNDTEIFYLINGLAGTNPVFDEFFKGVANDYFLIIIFCLFMAYIWFGTKDTRERRNNQISVIMAIIGIGIANGLIVLSNIIYFRERPFNELPGSLVNLLYYQPTDSSFPSNYTAVLFAIATATFIKNKKYGTVLLVLALIGGLARVYVGIHYPLDILGGLVIGAAAAAASYYIIEATKRIVCFLLGVLGRLFLA